MINEMIIHLYQTEILRGHWQTVAIFYLAMTLSISAVLRYYERRLMIGRRAVPAAPSDPQM